MHTLYLEVKVRPSLHENVLNLRVHTTYVQFELPRGEGTSYTTREYTLLTGTYYLCALCAYR